MILFVVAEHVALLVFGVVDYLRTGAWDRYQSIIVLILAYMLIWGKKDLGRLDRLVERLVSRAKARRGRLASGRSR